MNLQTALNSFRVEFLEKFPPQKSGVMQRATDALVEEFRTMQFLQVGYLSAKFSLPDAVGEEVCLSDKTL